MQLHENHKTTTLLHVSRIRLLLFSSVLFPIPVLPPSKHTHTHIYTYTHTNIHKHIHIYHHYHYNPISFLPNKTSFNPSIVREIEEQVSSTITINRKHGLEYSVFNIIY